MEKFTHPIVSVLVEKSKRSGLILLQTRRKPEASGFRLLELPQGHMREGESILDCAVRELYEETGLHDFKPRNEVEGWNIGAETLESLVTLVVAETGRRSFLAVCITGTARGKPRASEESEDPKWYTRADVRKFINEDKVFPLNIPMIDHYYSHLVD